MRLLTRQMALFFVIVSLPFGEVWAHGGEDHAESKPLMTSSGNVITRLARIGDFELFFKHTSIMPDQSATAHLFLSRYETNEPVDGARIEISFAGPIRARAEAKRSDLAGQYGIELPPLPQGMYRLTARVEVNGKSDMVDLGTLDVASTTTSEDVTNERITLQITIILLILLISMGTLWLIWRASSHRSKAEKEATAI